MTSSIEFNVYEICGFIIAAQNIEDAVSVFFEQSMPHDYYEPKEGETETLILEIYKFTAEEINTGSFPCCDDECSRCEGNGKPFFSSLYDIIAENKESWAFVIASPN